MLIRCVANIMYWGKAFKTNPFEEHTKKLAYLRNYLFLFFQEIVRYLREFALLVTCDESLWDWNVIVLFYTCGQSIGLLR